MKLLLIIIIVTAFYLSFSILVGKALNRLASETEKQDRFYPETKTEKITFKMRLRRLHKITNRIRIVSR
jgi:hypothetical protein